LGLVMHHPPFKKRFGYMGIFGGLERIISDIVGSV